MKKLDSRVGVAGVFLATVGALILLYFAGSLSIYLRVALAFAALMISGLAIQRVMGLDGGYGLYMVGSKKGLKTIDAVSKNHRKFWDAMAIWGLTLGFGLLAYPLLKGRIDRRVFALGILSTIFIAIFVQPYFSVAFQFINMPKLQTAVSSQASSLQSEAGLIAYALLALTVIFGFSGYIFVSILANAASILIGIAQFLISFSSGVTNTSTLSNQIPGIAPIIPGWNIPLVAGIASLAMLLIINEFSHGVLSRMAKVKLKSIGLLLFGIIPIGGYVEPDEKMVKRLDSQKQTRIFSAGIAANFMATIFFFALLFLVLNYIAPHAYPYGVVVTGTTLGYPANGVLKVGMQILQWKGIAINNISDLVRAGIQSKPGSAVLVVTDSGAFVFNAVPQAGNSSRGVIGVELGYQPVIKTPYAKAVYFIYTLLALSMLLNFLVAVVNLLPIPGFDGWRIYQANIKSKKFVLFLAAVVVAGIVINALPWLFYV
jgi:membrane-associated protease RseP (regulator of RpoE activity)